MNIRRSGSIFVYDAKCKYTRKILPKFSPDDEYIRPVPWQADPVQTFLKEQFGWTPFTSIFIDEHHIYTGEAAIGRLLRRCRSYKRVGRQLSCFSYRALTTRLGKLMYSRSPEYLHGVYLLDPAARVFIDTLRPAVDIPVK